MKLSVQATKKERLGRALESSLVINLPKAKTGLGTFFAPVAQPDQPVDLTAPLVLQRDKMRWCRERVVETDLKHQVELGKQTKLFTLRGALVSSMGTKLVRIRRVCLGLLDEGEFAEVGLVGPVSQDPTTMLRQGKKVLLAFSQPGLELKSPAWVKAKVEVDSLLDGLASNVEALDKVLDDISDQHRLVEGAAAEREQAFEVFNQSYLLIGRSAEASFRMAGMDAAAERARTTVRRLQRAEPEEEPVPEMGPVEAAEAGEETGDGETPATVSGADTTQ